MSGRLPSGYDPESNDVLLAHLDCSKRSGYVYPRDTCRYCSCYRDESCLSVDSRLVYARCRSNASMLARDSVLGRLRFWLYLVAHRCAGDWDSFDWLNSFQPCWGCPEYLGTVTKGVCRESFQLRRARSCTRRAFRTIIKGDCIYGL